MSPDVAAVLARLSRCIEDLHATESLLRRHRGILRESATALRTGERLEAVLARIDAARVWVGDLGARSHE